MDIITKLNVLYQYYKLTRGVGHTTLMKKGVENFDKDTLILTPNMNAGEVLGFNKDQIVTWNSLNKLRGHNKPLAIDNGTMMIILEDVIKELQNEKKKTNEKKNKRYNYT